MWPFKKKCFVIFGAPGSGKGTCSGTVCEKYGIIPISTGDLFRENVKNNTEIGTLAQTYMSKGVLVPDDITINMLKERISKKDAKGGVLLDGFPRTKTQVDALLKFAKVKLVVNLDVSDEIIINRLSKRKVCETCGINKAPGNDGTKCNCGGKFITRKDDNIDVIKNRLKTYYETTKPVLEYFKENNITIVDIVNRTEKSHEENINDVRAKLEAVKI